MAIAKQNRLSVKLLRVVLLSACLVGLVLSFAQIVYDAYSADETIDTSAYAMLAMVRDPAIQAVYSLDKEMASQVVEGLFENNSIRYAAIGHPDEPMLAEKSRPLIDTPYRWLTDKIFNQERTYKVNLFGRLPYSEYYGDLVITIDTARSGSEFVNRSIIIFTSGLLRAIAMATVLYLIYTWLLTKPLTRIIDNLSRINPDQPGQKKIPMLPGNENNELGLWIRTANQLLDSIDRNNTKRQKAEAHVLRLAQYDFLTGLPNRVMLQKELQQILQEASARNKSVAVLCCGIDDFKGVNEQFTYKVGDHILMALADRLRNQHHKVKAVGRLGGDQFAIIQDEIDQPYEAAELAQQVLSDLEEPFVINNIPISIRSTMGITLYPEDGNNPEKLLQKAEQTMTLAKTRSQNRFQFYIASVDTEMRVRRQLEKDLQRALENEELHLVYQPQVSYLTGRVAGAEALIRWIHPDKGFISPDLFIPLAEKSNTIIDIGEWVLNQACHQLNNWHQQGFEDFRIAVNLSAVQLRHEKIESLIADTIQKNNIPPHCLELEVTETGIMEDLSMAAAKLNSIKRSGVMIAIDDFGTGYSSLSYLKKLPFDKIKIDKSFVQDVLEDEENATIVRAIIQLSKSLNLSVIAEGVETVEQEAYIIEQGCQEGQGYYYSKPVSEEQFQQFIKKNYKAA
ncbi:putative bifunctional diguanylate cyclase/phosphodiesterase [Spartinivicinus poritis]|uniref:EAL domain-containing protein n=1 Tax=Spartinivicinus poritis TaxID=2994640 RepID=A0ABT5U8Z0_9GAMM|nr:GGDEF domain-containing phosphodiesterase [Spartinivicinus sp. A2-2]MDE1462847.1 EAL domain-containing protein [Spartinivicinus sp. A2-2]